MISVVGLCVLTVLLLLGLAAAQFMRSGGSVATAYEREMQLRLAAESAVETAAAEIERQAEKYVPPPDGEPRDMKVNAVPTAEDIELYVSIKASQNGAVLDIKAAAYTEEETRIPDGENWMRGKIVHGRMVKKEKGYVWQRWY